MSGLSVMAELGGFAVRFSQGSGRYQSHQDQGLAADLFRETLRNLVFNVLGVARVSGFESIWWACQST